MSDETRVGGSYDSPSDIGTKPADVVKRWVLEIDLASKAQKKWIKKAQSALERYGSEKEKKNSFNILWANTETLRQAIYNTLPKPDVRRRFRDDDPVAKVVSQTLERCLDFTIDAYDFDQVLKLDLLDMLLPGRGISVVRYVPDFEDIEADNSASEPAEGTSESDDGMGEADKTAASADKSEPLGEEGEPQQRIKYESVICEHVQYDDFLHGPGKTWDEVRWIGLRHNMTQAAGIEKFGNVFKDVTMDDVADEAVKKSGPEVSNLFRTVDVWEIWDKDEKKVLFLVKSYKSEPLNTVLDPLELDGFFPVPRPLLAIERATSLEPIVLFDQYKEQAEELDRITLRINKLTDALKLRGIYNAVIGEISKLESSPDNTLIAAENVVQLEQSGGLEKNIWFMPIEEAANVIKVLSEQREACKSVIYELTGIADIMRGASSDRETLGAQQIKSQWGTQRLKKMQSEFQRYVRDILRLKAQVIANKFQPETIIDMTGIKLAMSEAEKQQIAQQAQAFQQFQQMQQAQRPPGPPQGAPPGAPPGPPAGPPGQPPQGMHP